MRFLKNEAWTHVRLHPINTIKPRKEPVNHPFKLCSNKCVGHYRERTKINYYLKQDIKGLIHPKMKITPCFTHPQGILGVYDFLLSDESNQSYIKNCPGSSKR